MIQFIGLMIGAYIIVRMIDLVLDKNKTQAIQIVATINIFITLFFMLMILASGSTMPKY